MAYLSFQTIFFERFIACFKIRGNVGFFIITIDFVGYLGTLALLLFKEFYASHIDWQSFYNHMSFWIGIVCCIAFMGSFVYMIQAKKDVILIGRSRTPPLRDTIILLHIDK